MSRRSWIIVAVVVALVVAAVPTGFIVLKHRREAADRAAQQAAAESFAQAWTTNKLASLSFAGAAGADVAKTVGTATAKLTSAAHDAPSAVKVGKVSCDGSSRTVSLQVSWKLPGDRAWQYPATLTVVKQDGKWLPKYAPTVIHPKLMDKGQLVARTQEAKRGEIIGANDKVLVTERPVVSVGLEPGRADDIGDSAQQIAAIVDVDAAALAKRAEAASPKAFVEAISLRKPAYDKLKAQLQPIPGAVFQDHTRSLAPTSEFARALIGSVGEATAEIVEKSKGRVRAGDITGLSGLQQAYDEQLSGKPGLTVKLVPPAAEGAASTDAAAAETLFNVDAVAGKPVQITLDETIQVAADKALEAATKPAALVAIRASTGEVLAVANGGPNASGYNRALLGRYPPGSTFKVASTLALLQAGLSPQTVVKCPATLNVGGKEFSNAEDEVLGSVQFHSDFAHSCNTAFVGSSTRIDVAELAKAAKSLGFGQPNKLGVNAFTGKVPTSGDAVSHAAAMIGQSTVLASPVTVAGASAAVASGSWHAPRLVIEPGQAADKGTALPAGPVAELRKLMREVVTNGTAPGLKSTPGGPVAGKTGTAEYGQDVPPRTHAWFTGFQGDIAFAAVVEDGGFGAKAAGPLVKNFLTRLAQ